MIRFDRSQPLQDYGPLRADGTQPRRRYIRLPDPPPPKLRKEPPRIVRSRSGIEGGAFPRMLRYDWHGRSHTGTVLDSGYTKEAPVDPARMEKRLKTKVCSCGKVLFSDKECQPGDGPGDRQRWSLEHLADKVSIDRPPKDVKIPKRTGSEPISALELEVRRILKARKDREHDEYFNDADIIAYENGVLSSLKAGIPTKGVTARLRAA